MVFMQGQIVGTNRLRTKLWLHELQTVFTLLIKPQSNVLKSLQQENEPTKRVICEKSASKLNTNLVN